MNSLLMSFIFILSRTMDKVDSTMNAVNEQRELANEIAETLANPIYGGVEVDEVRPSLSIFLSCFSPHVISAPFYHFIRTHIRKRAVFV